MAERRQTAQKYLPGKGSDEEQTGFTKQQKELSFFFALVAQAG